MRLFPALCLLFASCRLQCTLCLRDEIAAADSRHWRDTRLASRQATESGSYRHRANSHQSSAGAEYSCTFMGSLAPMLFCFNILLLIAAIFLGYKLRDTRTELEQEKELHMKDTHDFLQRLQAEESAHKKDNDSFLQQLDDASHELEDEQVAHEQDNVTNKGKLDREKLEHEYDGYRLKGKHAQYLMQIRRLEQQIERNVAKVKSAQQIADKAHDDMANALTGFEGVRNALGEFYESSPDAEKESAHWVWRMPNVCGGRARAGTLDNKSQAVILSKAQAAQAVILSKAAAQNEAGELAGRQGLPVPVATAAVPAAVPVATDKADLERPNVEIPNVEFRKSGMPQFRGTLENPSA